ncbi:HEAT repeat domain-containing protein [Thiolapillus sp.]
MNKSADTFLLVAPGCPHCASVLQSLSQLVKKGDIGRLEVVNIAVHPEAAQEVGARSVPWMRIGAYELSGNYTPGELAEWARKAASGAASADYIREMLEQQELDKALHYIEKQPEALPQLLELMQDNEGSLSVKFGVGALFEELEGSELLRGLVPALGELTRSDKANIRGDAAHYLGLSHSEQARDWLLPLLEDPQQDVREIAAESLDMLDHPA